MYQQLLMPIDGSACSEHALMYGLDLAKTVGATVTFLYVVENPLNIYNMEHSLVYEPKFHQDLVRNGELALARAAERAREAGVTARVLLHETRIDDPVPGILETEGAFDMVVIATHGRRGFDRLTLGSVTEKLLHRSDKPHLIVRCPAETVAEDRRSSSKLSS